MESKNIKIETAIGIILVVCLIVIVLIYRAGKMPEVVTKFIPQRNNSQSKQQENPERILFATNGSREIYKVKKDDKWAVEIDGQLGEAYDDVFDGVFSEDGEHFAYGATDGEESLVVLDNVGSGKRYQKIEQILFSKDGILIYKVSENNEEFLVVDGKEGQHFENIGQIVVLDDGRIAFQAELNGEQVTVINGEVVADNGGGNSTVTTGSTSQSENSGPSGGSSSSSTKKSSTTSNRPQRDLSIPTQEKSYPVCTGTGCNF